MSNSILSSVGIKEFKCFEALTIELGQLTILSGINGGGKSTVLQSILLFSQALRRVDANREFSIWPLNGKLIRLGTCGDIVRPNDNNIQFEYKFGEQSEPIRFEFNAERGETYLKELKSKSSSEIDVKSVNNVQFISALRGVISDITSIPDDPNYYIDGVGTDGRFAGYWYNKFSGKTIDESRVFSQNEDNSLDIQVNAWLNYISPGTRVNVDRYENTSIFVLQFQLSEQGEWCNSANVGFGISYVFPIIIALLSAKKGDLIVIDSPEAHLHPQAQSRVGKMITKFAEAGVQVILETHSDHILNGVRLAVKQGVLNPRNLGLLFFSGVTESGHGVISTEIDKNGNIEYWPPGFFDQIDSDIVELLSDD